MSNDKYQFINSYYIREKYQKIGHKYTMTQPDKLILVYKVNDEQILKVVETPDFSFRMAKPNIDIPYPLDHLPLSDTDVVTVKYRDLFKELAKRSGKESEYFSAKSSGDYNLVREMKNNLQRHERFFGSDINIDDHYKMKFFKQYGNHIGGYKKAFFDIETDVLIGKTADFRNPQSPVYCITYIDQTTNVCYVWVWDRPDIYPTLHEVKEDIPGLLNRINNQIRKTDEAVSNHLGYPNIKYSNMQIELRFFPDEIDLIKDYYKVKHETKPDFEMAWNFSFDNMTLINRLRQGEEKYGYRTEDIVCHPDVPPECRFIEFNEDTDQRIKEHHLKWHWLNIPGYTQDMCSMAMHANIRKSQGTEPSYTLEYIASKELGVGKYDYSAVADDIFTLPYNDFPTSIVYNVIDTYLLWWKEKKHNDIDVIMYSAEVTKLRSCTKITSVIKNTQTLFYEESGLAIGNNVNALNHDREYESFEGAIVSDPTLNAKNDTPIFPYKTNTIYTYTIDNDLTSMYPSIMVAHNIYRTTLLFHVFRLGDLMNTLDNSFNNFEIGKCFDNFETGDVVRFGNEYLGLPSLENMINTVNNLIGVNKEVKNDKRISTR